MYKGSCHCGNVRFEVDQVPEKLVDCNCSLCRRIGALWGHVAIGSVRIVAEEGSTLRYVQGDRTLATHTCRECGCTTHWENLQADGEHMGVNFRMCDPDLVLKFEIRRLDGADTWKFLD